MSLGEAMLKTVTGKAEIKKCQKMLEDSLKNALKRHELLRIGYQGGSFENDVYYSEGLWYSTQLLERNEVRVPKYWNGFGLGKREDGNQIIVVEINPPVEGVTKQVAGLFAKDENTGAYFILHRGKVGGGRKGIGKHSFEAWYRGSWVSVIDAQGNIDEAALVATLGSDGLIDQIKHFVEEVDKFKEEVRVGASTRSPQTGDKNLTFDPESHGKRKTKRTATFEYETYHGLVVNALGEKLKASGKYDNATIFNTRLIDLGIQVNGKTCEIFEVKSSSDRQSIYTGIGQLMFHTSGKPNIGKTLVLPSDEFPKRLIRILNQLGIHLLKYEIKRGQVKFVV
jgi:hypothetical protein